MSPITRSLSRPSTSALAGVVVAAALIAVPSPAHATATSSAPGEQWEVSRSISADLGTAGDWRGHLTVTHEEVRAGTTAPVRRLVIDVMLVRRTCDIGGCMETVLRTEPAATTARWSPHLASASVASDDTVPVRVRRYAVDAAGALTSQILEDRVVQLRVTLRARSTGGDYTSSFRSTSAGTVTVSRSRQVSADVVVALGGLRIASSAGSMSWSRRLTRTVP